MQLAYRYREHKKNNNRSLGARLMVLYAGFIGKNRSLRVPVFRKFLLMRLNIILALNMQATIMSYFVYQLTCDPKTGKGDAMVLGLLGLWEVIPAIGFSLFSGHITDIMEKKGLLMRCLLPYFGLGCFFVWLAVPGTARLFSSQYIIWMVYGGIFAGGALRAFLSPTTFALMGLILPRRLYTNAATWSSASWQTGFVIGPLLAGGLIASAGFMWALVAVAVIISISIFTAMYIPKQPLVKKSKEPILKSLGEGIRFVFSTQLILAALSLDMFAVLFGGAVALLPVYANEILNVGEVGYGWMRAAPGIGSITALMILSLMPLKKNPGGKLLMAIAGFGVTTIIFGVVGDICNTRIMGSVLGCPVSWAFMLAMLMLLLGGMFDAISVVIRSTILQVNTPDSMRGRVAAVNTMFISSSNELGAMESGATAKWMGTVPAVVFGGCMTLVVVGVTYFAAPMLRALKLDGKEHGDSGRKDRKK